MNNGLILAALDKPLETEGYNTSDTSISSTSSNKTSSGTNSAFKSVSKETMPTVEFQEVEIQQQTNNGPNYVRLGVVAGIIVIAGVTIALFKHKRKKKQTKTKIRSAKIKAANDKFNEKREEVNDKLTDYANSYLSQYDFHDDDTLSEEIVFRDLYEEKDDSFKYKEKETEEEDIYEDAASIRQKERKIKAKELIKDGIDEDIDTYFEKYTDYKAAKEPEDPWSFRNEEIETQVKQDKDYIGNIDSEENTLYKGAELHEDTELNNHIIEDEETQSDTPIWTKFVEDEDDEDGFF
ncbi:hypothetical protein [Lachnospira multipara]|uniref:hypothetical protein n=1 Tax=Lachnospira multipara TaxID=28051 RepID=UPI000488CF8F|nr:hypothetical protein [Lachnospira multipara]